MYLIMVMTEMSNEGVCRSLQGHVCDLSVMVTKLSGKLIGNEVWFLYQLKLRSSSQWFTKLPLKFCLNVGFVPT